MLRRFAETRREALLSFNNFSENDIQTLSVRNVT